jgi:hypothetical protein
MGTRHLTCVFANNQMRIAQYGQFDGYPDGAGSIICDFIHKTNMDEFRSKVEKVTQVTEEKMNLINSQFESKSGWMTIDESNRYGKAYPEFHRNTGADILNLVMGGVTEVNLDTDFVNDSLFCEYAYVVNLDTNELEFYEGFQKEVHSQGRFANSVSNKDGYYPVKLTAKIPFEDIKQKGFAALQEVLPKEEE